MWTKIVSFFHWNGIVMEHKAPWKT